MLILGGGWYGLTRVNHVLASYKPEIESLLSKKLGYQIQYKELTLSIGASPKLMAVGVDASGIVHADFLEATFRILPLISRRLEIAHLTIVAPVVDADKLRTTVALQSTPESVYVQPVTFSIDTSRLTEGNFYFDIDAVEITRGKVTSARYRIDEISLTSKIKYRNGERISLEAIKLSCFLNNVRVGLQGALGIEAGDKNISAEDLLVSYDGNDVRLQGDLGYESGSGRIIVLDSKLLLEKFASLPYGDMLRANKVAGTINAKGTITLQRFLPKVSLDLSVNQGAFQYNSLPITEVTGSALIEGSVDGVKLSSSNLKGNLKGIPVLASGDFSYPDNIAALELEIKKNSLSVLMPVVGVFVKNDELSELQGEVEGNLRMQFSPSRSTDFAGSSITLSSVRGSFKNEKFEQLNGQVLVLADNQLSFKDLSAALSGSVLRTSGTLLPNTGNGELTLKSSGVSVATIKSYLPSVPFTEGEIIVDGKLILESWKPQFQGKLEIKEGALPLNGSQTGISKISLSSLITRAGGNEEFFAIRDATGLIAEGEVASLSVQGAIQNNGINTVEVKKGDLSLLGGAISFKGVVTDGGQVGATVSGLAIQRLSKLYPELQGKISGVLSGQFTVDRRGISDVTGGLEIVQGALKEVNVTKLVIEKLATIPLVGERLMYSLPKEFDEYLTKKDTELKKVQATFASQEGEVKVNPLFIEFDAGEVHAEGTISLATSEVKGSMLVSLRRELSIPILQKNSGLRSFVNERGMIQIPIQVRGTLKEPSFKPDIHSIGVAGIEGALLGALERKLSRRGRDGGQYEDRDPSSPDAPYNQ